MADEKKIKPVRTCLKLGRRMVEGETGETKQGPDSTLSAFAPVHKGNHGAGSTC
jgi:hypothetical protein